MINPTSMNNIESVLSQIRQYQAEASSGIQPDHIGLEQTTNKAAFTDSIKTRYKKLMQLSRHQRRSEMPMSEVMISL